MDMVRFFGWLSIPMLAMIPASLAPKSAVLKG